MDYIAHRQVRQRVERLIPTDNVVYLSDAVEEKRYEDIRQFVETELTEQDQRIFRMRFDEKMTYKEIAEELDVTEKTVYKHLHQAITKLQEHFNGQDNE
jgi:RNA polymerase sigma-70 factor (ECF subfamily)